MQYLQTYCFRKINNSDIIILVTQSGITMESEDITDMSAVTNLLKPLEPKWHELGIQLKIEKAVLDRIEADHKGVQRCLSELIDYWQKNKENPSWLKLMDAVKKLGGQNDVVKSIRRNLHSSCSFKEGSDSGYPSSGLDSDQDASTTTLLSPGCGCGECNIHKMCTEGCPDPDHNKHLPILTKYTNPGGESTSKLASDTLTPNNDGQENSFETFEKETSELQSHFGSLVLKTSRSLEKRGEKKTDVALYLLNSFPMLKKITTEIKQATDMATLFTEVTCQACSWFNFDIIKGVINEFKRDDDDTIMSNLEAYEHHFEKFAKQRLPHGMTHVEVGSKAGMTGCRKLVIKVDREWESISIGELERLCIEFAKTLGAQRKDIYLADVTEGCIMLTLMIPEEIVDSLSKTWLTSTQKEMLVKERVVRLTCEKLTWSTSSPANQLSSNREEDEMPVKEVPKLKSSQKVKTKHNRWKAIRPTKQITAWSNKIASHISLRAKKNKKHAQSQVEDRAAANPNLKGVLAVTKLQCDILMDQCGKLWDAANDAGQTQIREIVDELKFTNKQMNKKLNYIESVFLAAEKRAEPSLSPCSSISSTSSNCYSDEALEVNPLESEIQALSIRPKSHSLPRDLPQQMRKKPLLPPTKHRLSSQLGPIITSQLPALQRDMARKSPSKPTPPPKPKAIPMTSTHEKRAEPSLSPCSSISSTSSNCYSDEALEVNPLESEIQALSIRPKSHSLPRDLPQQMRKKPLLPPTKHRLSSQLGPIITSQLPALQRDMARKSPSKPTPPPKPKAIPMTSTHALFQLPTIQLDHPVAVVHVNDDDDQYSELTSGDTGDSGFAEVGEFLRPELRREPPKPLAPAHSVHKEQRYMGLRNDTMEPVGYYM